MGEQGPQFHAEAGAQARAAGIATLYALGTLSAHTAQAHGSAVHFESMEQLQSAVCSALPHVGSVLVKGSRFMKMERVVEAIAAAAAPQATQQEQGKSEASHDATH